MTLQDILPFIVVAAAAGYVGYQLGRQSALLEGRGYTGEPSPLPAPDDASPAAAPSPQRRSAPPPATAGGDGGGRPQTTAASAAAPRRTTAPPPAAAGLADLDGKK